MNFTILAEGLNGLYTTLIDNWLGPAYLIFVAACAIKFIKDQEFRKLFSYVGIATVVALLIYSGKTFLGKGGKLNKAAEDVVNKVGGN